MVGIPNPDNLDEILSTSRMVKEALRRGGPHALDAINSPPVYCCASHSEEVRGLLRLMFAQSPLHSCSLPEHIPDEPPNPIFLYLRHKPVPQEFWDRLDKLRALRLCIDGMHKG
jgi:hypothetical protein